MRTTRTVIHMLSACSVLLSNGGRAYRSVNLHGIRLLVFHDSRGSGAVVPSMHVDRTRLDFRRLLTRYLSVSPHVLLPVDSV